MLVKSLTTLAQGDDIQAETSKPVADVADVTVGRRQLWLE